MRRRAGLFCMRGLFAALGLLFAAALTQAQGAQTRDGKAPESGAISLEDARARAAKAAPTELAALLEQLAARLTPTEALRFLDENNSRLSRPAEKAAAARRGAELCLLLGRFSEAAARYEAASALVPGDKALLGLAARAYLAAGEAERAADIASAMLIAPDSTALAPEARLLGAWSLAFRGRVSDARAALEAMIGAPGKDRPSPEQLREALFLLWSIADGPGAKKAAAERLAAAFPGSPEADIAAGRLARLDLPHWYLSGLGLVASIDEGPEPQAKAPPAGDAHVERTPAPQAGTRILYFQLGYFSREENARQLRDELTKKGFPASVEARQSVKTASGLAEKRWIVLVEPGRDPELLKARLKDAGYESYPVFEGDS